MKSCLRMVFATALFAACSSGDQPRADSAGIAKDSILMPDTALIAALPLRALGTEPFWALDIDTAGLRFITPDDTAGLRFPYSKSTIVSDTSIWTAGNVQSAITVRVWREKCSDGMSDREYPFAARILKDTITYRGCADRRAAIVRGTN